MIPETFYSSKRKRKILQCNELLRRHFRMHGIPDTGVPYMTIHSLFRFLISYRYVVVRHGGSLDPLLALSHESP